MLLGERNTLPGLSWDSLGKLSYRSAPNEVMTGINFNVCLLIVITAIWKGGEENI